MKISFRNISIFIALIFIIVFQNVISYSQPTDASHIELRNLGSENEIAYIDISKLESQTEQSTLETPIILDWSKKSAERKSFYRNGEMYNDTCNGGSVLRPGVIQLCLPYADIGYHIATPDQQLSGEFVSLNGFGLNIYYEVNKNRFYFFGCCWNYVEGFGPFAGDPRIEIPKAVKPRRKKALKLNLKTEISQRWINPKADEEAAILENDKLCSTGYCPPTPRQLQSRRLNGVIIKIRVKNTGNKTLYYYPFDNNYMPALYKSVENKDFYRQNREKRLEPNPYKEWKIFPPKSVYEFEIEGVGIAKTDAMILMYFNDKPVFWDEVEYGIKFRSMYRKLKSESD